MAAKLLHSLTDDNPDLQKQIGCMTGIFQIFDRQHVLPTRRISGHSPKMISSGSSRYSSSSETEINSIYNLPTSKDKYSSKNVNEKHRVSMESSRASFSSSSRSSSFSSLDYNRTAQPEPLSFDRMIFPETPSRDAAMSQSGASPKFGRQSLDLRDVVKDSMYREARGLSVKTQAKQETSDHFARNKDSPRPLQLSNPIDGMPTLPSDLRESLRVLAKLRESPWYSDEPSQTTDGYLLPKDARRFSYDGRETNRLSFDSRDTFKSTTKLKELPRLSLDSRECSARSLDSDSHPNFLFRNSRRDSEDFKESLPAQSRPPSVVAKLMGLEALPQATASDSHMGLIKTSRVDDVVDPFERSFQKQNSSRNMWKEPDSPRWRQPESVAKSMPSSRFPMEPAPWKQVDGGRASQKPALRHVKAPVRHTNTFPSVYGEIDKRLKDLEFTQSGKDLRALKQILEAMQAKGLLETRREEQEATYTNPHLSSRLVNHQRPLNNSFNSSVNKEPNSSRSYESPIVIMKPAKLVERSGIPASSVIPMDRFPSLPKLRNSDNAERRKSSVNSHPSKEQIPKSSSRENAKSTNRTLKSTSTRPQQLPKENVVNLTKNSGSVSPRLQQKKLELEKRSRPPVSPDSTKFRRQPNKQQLESTSPGGRRRLKSLNMDQSDDRSNQVNSESRKSSSQEVEMSTRSGGSTVSVSVTEQEVTSSEHCVENKGNDSPSTNTSKHSVSGVIEKKQFSRLSEDGVLAEFTSVSSEHPSPVSVLDGTMYREDVLSPVKQIPDTLKDDGKTNRNAYFSREQQDSADNLTCSGISSGMKPGINRKKLENIENLVQKLRRLNSSHDEAQTDYIASLCENTNPDHRYISEILLASGLLLRDLDSSLTSFQLHPSGFPINPELFLVLEQTKASAHDTHLKPESGKSRRKLIFDAVNEILTVKLASVGACPEPWQRPAKIARKSVNAQKLLRELCSEIELLQAKKPKLVLEGDDDDDDDDGLKGILRDDVIRSERWTAFDGEMSAIVLDVERSIFKDLVGEIVHGEAAGLRSKSGGRCRQLFL